MKLLFSHFMDAVSISRLHPTLDYEVAGAGQRNFKPKGELPLQTVCSCSGT
jgi:hypothetical protein